MVPQHCAVSHAILAEFGREWSDLRLCERDQPPEHAMPQAGRCRKFAMRSEGGRMLFGFLEPRLAARRWGRPATRALLAGEAV